MGFPMQQPPQMTNQFNPFQQQSFPQEPGGGGGGVENQEPHPPRGCLKDMDNTVKEFSTGYSTAHGLPNIYLAGNVFTRIFWTLVFLTAMGAYMYQMQKVVRNFLDFNVSTEVRRC